MSTQINQYLMYGIRLPYSWKKEWEEKNNKNFYDIFEEFMDDNAFNTNIGGKDGIFCLISEKNIYIGKVFVKTCDDDPFLDSMELPEISVNDKIDIGVKIGKYFEIWQGMTFYIITYSR